MAANEGSQPTLKGPSFCFFCEVGDGFWVFWIFWVLTEFPTCSLNFPCVPQYVPNSTSLHLMSFATKFYCCNLHKQPKRRRLWYIYFETVQSLIKLFCDGLSNQLCPSQKEKNWTWGSSQLINTSHTIVC